LTVLQGVDVTQAHIHCGEPGENGPIVVFLAGLAPRGIDVDGNWIRDASFSDRHITNPACGETLAELAQAMREGRTYVNVHTVANPGGEIRGQLERN
ncbi:MAG: CHRD domain-containing protein, partial [Acidimicrobiia bacterium]